MNNECVNLQFVSKVVIMYLHDKIEQMNFTTNLVGKLNFIILRSLKEKNSTLLFSKGKSLGSVVQLVISPEARRPVTVEIEFRRFLFVWIGSSVG